MKYLHDAGISLVALLGVDNITPSEDMWKYLIPFIAPIVKEAVLKLIDKIGQNRKSKKSKNTHDNEKRNN